MQCTQIIGFDSAHRIIGHKGKCRMLHGHRYTLEATFESNQLNELGMVIDFGIIKQKLNNWLNSNWDHNTILNIKDQKLGNLISNITGQKIFYLNENPTAENMANFLLLEVCLKIFNDEPVRCSKIKLYETPNCYVTTINKV
jgi:6-pyruvoyltetrahydropterin/6-carboxytetrahydropterin synthase